MLSRAELYEFHASECVRAAERTDDPELRERFLRLAREWMLDIANLPLSECGPRTADAARLRRRPLEPSPPDGISSVRPA
jgi:hypothetical protein